ncbi:MAG: SDR family oxidoreductase [Paracoccaceae bacterium]|nr:SDR family oxidoreductase [Paracoccaceae bacterium]
MNESASTPTSTTGSEPAHPAASPPVFPDLAGQSVFVTGGGSGIGAALVEGFLQQGAHVAFVQRSDAGEFCDRMESRHGSRPLFIRCDITDIGALQSAIGQVADVHGPIRVLVNNAANDTRHKTLEVTEAFWNASQAINLRPYFFAAQAVIPGMQQAGGGSIVNFSSISYMVGNSGYPSYVAANSGITGLTRGLAREFGKDRIRVNAIAPGWVLTERQKRLWATPEALSAHLARQCIPEHLVEADIVSGVLFLASSASRMMTGQIMAIDGGVVTTG